MLNPIVRYIETFLPEAREIDVTDRGTLRITNASGRIERIALSEAVQAFLEAFHRGAYPELEERSNS